MSRSLRFPLAAVVLLSLACNGRTPAAPTPEPTPAPTPTPEPTATPRPAADPGSISYIRVAFYGIECTNGQRKPNNTDRKLPVGCTGFVTATPKKADGTDVHSSEHGPDISWELVHGERQVRVIDDEHQPFNKQIRGRSAGPFSLCATVKTVTGCLNGEVVS